MNENGNISDKFRIMGNPRDEKVYYGADPIDYNPEKDIEQKIKAIRGDEKWFEDIKRKAEKNGVSQDVQLYRDACWAANIDSQNGQTNNRYKRNPRMGSYSFLLIVANEQALAKIPKYIKDISQTDSSGRFVNPYTYFLKGKGQRMSGLTAIKSTQVLKLRTILSGEQGIFIDRLTFGDIFRVFPDNKLVGDNDTLYRNAIFTQYFHDIAKDRFIRNIPLVADVLSGNYNAKMYEQACKTYADSTKRLIDHPVITDYPGKTLRVNDDGSISLINPGNYSGQKSRKESVGVKSRIGFTYGKFRGKIKFPAILNQSGVWSGLTNAFWLIYQSEATWNKRRDCNNKGYVTYEKDAGKDYKRETSTNYSEIDIEIVKTSKYWGGTYETQPKNYNPFDKTECVLACTNWDLACPSPNKFFAGGGHHHTYCGKKFTYVRWYDTYRALTSRVAIPNSIFACDYYYYEIEWRPEEIIWRIGKTPQEMQIVGYINRRFSVIPSNQMLAVVTQEWHYSEFWPPVLYRQDFIPYPKNDIVGRVYEIAVE